MSVVADELMAILVCPDCHGDLEERPDPRPEQAGEVVLVCVACGLHYPVREGIPIMLIDEAFRPEES